MNGEPPPGDGASDVGGYPGVRSEGSTGTSGAKPRTAGVGQCKHGAKCFNFDPEHRRRFAHPEEFEDTNTGGTATDCQRKACKYGKNCYQKSKQHLKQFAHPGDRHYRLGLVLFEDNQHPDFETLRQMFQFYDPEESGHLSKTEFEYVYQLASVLAPSAEKGTLDEAWTAADGPVHGYVNFRQFTTWTQSCLKLSHPIGLEASGDECRPCRFRGMEEDGDRCGCQNFEAPKDKLSVVCAGCGHKESMHRSEFAEQTVSEFLEDASCGKNWQADSDDLVKVPGTHLVKVSDPELLRQLQELMNASHKTHDNWTRDRGCKNHGVNGCDWACASRNRVPVPQSFQLKAAYRNQNADLWQKYSLVKTAIAEECARPSKEVPYKAGAVASSVELDTPVNSSCNEWHLFHGTSQAGCRAISCTNFRLVMAGSGATWKDPKAEKGTPLYGFGLYFAERITKADEYSGKGPSMNDDGTPGPELQSVLVCRVVGGKSNVVTTNEIDKDKLRADVFDGPYHSVFGDREITLGKPYREIVVYDKDCVYPEFLIEYERAYG